MTTSMSIPSFIRWKNRNAFHRNGAVRTPESVVTDWY